MRVVRAAALLTLCAVAAAGCGTKHHSTLVLKAVGKADRQALDAAVIVLRRRIDLLGIHDLELRPSARRIVVTTRRALTPSQQRVLTTQGSLAFYDLEADLAAVSTNGYATVASARLDRLLARARADYGGTSRFVLVDSGGQLVGGPAPTRALLPRKPGAEVLAVPEHTTVVSCATSTGCPGVFEAGPRARTVYYLFQHYSGRTGDAIPELTGRDLDASQIRADVSSTGQGNVVLIGFKSEGAKKFHEITQTEAARGQALANADGRGRASDLSTVTRYAQHFAIVLDGELKSTPYIDYKQNPEGIDPSGTGAEISNIQSPSEAKNLAVVLRSGALRVRLVVAR